MNLTRYSKAFFSRRLADSKKMSQVRKSDIQDTNNKVTNMDQYGPDPSSEELSIKKVLKDNKLIQ